MKKFHARRLLKLAAHLLKVPRRQFLITTWCRGEECGTVACVGGWGGLMPAFRRLGFESTPGIGVVFRPVTKQDKAYVQEVHDAERALDGCLPARASKVFVGFEACDLFFGTDPILRLYHFSGYPEGGHVAPRQVAKRLRQVVKEYQPEVYQEYLAKKRAAKAAAA